MTGLKVKLPPPPPGVLAVPGQVTCGESAPDPGGIRCERPRGHAGGHLSQSRDRYWPAAVTS